MHEIDQITLNFSEEGLRVLNFVLGFVMFSISLDLKPKYFREVLNHPKAFFLGVFAQLLLLPALTFILVLILQPQASVALGMILVAACPGGNISNFITHRAGGNSALSVSLTGFSTLACILTTPINVAAWGSLYAPSREILSQIFIDPLSMVFVVGILLGVPLLLGIITAYRFPNFVAKYRKIFQNLSMTIFVAFIVIALGANWKFFLQYAHLVFFTVFLHNGVSLLTGNLVARLGGLSIFDRRALTIETGIQNSGLGLILIFQFFEGLGGMAVIAALWGIWHAISGIFLATWMSRKPLNSQIVSSKL